MSPRGKGARAFPLNWKALPTSKTCVCVRMLESAPGTRPSAQFDCLDLGLAVCRSFRVAAVLLRVLVASRPPSLLCPGPRLLRLLVPVPLFCGFSCLGVVAELFRLPSLSCIDDAETRMLLKQLGLLLDSSLFRIFGLCCAGAQCSG